MQERYDYKSVWTDNTQSLFLASGGLLRKLNLATMTYKTINTGQSYISNYVRGIKMNDVFVVGQSGEVAHGNGSGWYVFPELKNLANGDVWWQSIYHKANFVIVGGGYYTGFNFAPIVARGYR